MQNGTDKIFTHTLDASLGYPSTDLVLRLAWDSLRLQELETAIKDLEKRGQTLAPDLVANIQFGLGRDDYRHNRLDAAIEKYQQSLNFWRQRGDRQRQGMLLFHLGLCYKQQADLDRSENQHNWETAQQYFQQCLDVFEQANRPDIVASFIGQLGEILRCLSRWDELQGLAQKSLQLHQTYPNPARLARDYGFLAEIAIVQENWPEANQLAQQAIQVLAEAPEDQWQRRGLYLLLLAKSQRHLNQMPEGIASLERAKTESNPQDDPSLYIHILDVLRKFYFKQKKYIQAFAIKQEQLSVENQYGFRAFIGAGRLQPRPQPKSILLPSESQEPLVQEVIAQEIAASDRKHDIDRLVERISRDNFRLTIIHGQSGVGKSSTVNAGLVPTLQQEIINTRDVLPISLQFYKNWERSLGKFLAETLMARGESLSAPLNSANAILEQLRQNEDRNLLTVLIFDQFEEFFIGFDKPAFRQPFFDFLSQCFKIPFVKVILVIREDYIHFLLEYERLPDANYISKDILNRVNRYELGNFTPEDTTSIIQGLTERSQFYLEPALVDELVRDLAKDLGEVRPIELQIVGAQLQAENIMTLAQYQERGPKAQLVQRYLAEVVEDCGPENRRAAELVLYLLTGENDTRPSKTRAEIEKDLKALASGLAAEAGKLDLVLQIFVESGLVFLLPEVPASRYQLVHDYLVTFIRRQQEPKLDELIAELESEREQRRQTEEERDRLSEVIAQLEDEKAQRKQTEQDLKQAQRRIRRGTIAVLMSALAVILVGGITVRQFREAQISGQGAKLERQGWLALQKFESEPLKSLVNAMEIGQKLKRLTNEKPLLDYPAFSPIFALQQMLDHIWAQNQILGHQGPVYGVSFTLDGRRLATVSEDGTARLWDLQGNELAQIKGHQEEVYGVSLSPDGQYLATASADGTARVWDLQGNPIAKLKGHAGPVRSVSFSPDGQYLATASADGTAQVWNLQGNSLAELKGHQGKVHGVSFSPDGQYLATAGADSIARVWDLQGNPIAEFSGHAGPVRSVSFSPNGQYLATAGADSIARVWDLQGNPIAKFSGHAGPVRSVSFSPNGQYLATAGADRTARLWNFQGIQLFELKGHEEEVYDISFSLDGQHLATASGDGSAYLWNLQNKQLANFRDDDDQLAPLRDARFSPDGRHLVTVAVDGAIRLWEVQNGQQLVKFQGHNGVAIYDVSFSPNGESLATASQDGTARLWDLKGNQLAEFKADSGAAVWSTSFSPDGKLLATASADNSARLWDLQGHPLVELKGHEGSVQSISFSHDGKLLATGSVDKTVRLWNLEGNLINTLKGHAAAVKSIDFSPNQEQLATASADGNIRLWDLQGKILRNFQAHANPVHSIRFSPDGDRLATASADGTSRMWDLKGDLLAEFGNQGGAIRSADFDPNGQHIVIASENGSVGLWWVDEDLDELLERGCQWLKDFLITRPSAKQALSVCQDG